MQRAPGASSPGARPPGVVRRPVRRRSTSSAAAASPAQPPLDDTRSRARGAGAGSTTRRAGPPCWWGGVPGPEHPSDRGTRRLGAGRASLSTGSPARDGGPPTRPLTRPGGSPRDTCVRRLDLPSGLLTVVGDGGVQPGGGGGVTGGRHECNESSPEVVKMPGTCPCVRLSVRRMVRGRRIERVVPRVSRPCMTTGGAGHSDASYTTCPPTTVSRQTGSGASRSGRPATAARGSVDQPATR